jgi:pSer/pThr/pTyr-binding forkhead associated (FHA) protein
MDELIHLRVVQGNDNGQEFSIPRSGSLVGRAMESDIVIHDEKLSRSHCRFLYGGGKLKVTDLESSNGTFVNGKAIRDVFLKVDDRIAIGDTVFKVLCDSLRAPLNLTQEAKVTAAVPEPPAPVSLTTDTVVSAAPRPPAPVRPREFSPWIYVAVWITLAAWFLFLIYSLIQRGSETPAASSVKPDEARAAAAAFRPSAGAFAEFASIG